MLHVVENGDSISQHLLIDPHFSIVLRERSGWGTDMLIKFIAISPYKKMEHLIKTKIPMSIHILSTLSETERYLNKEILMPKVVQDIFKTKRSLFDSDFMMLKTIIIHKAHHFQKLIRFM